MAFIECVKCPSIHTLSTCTLKILGVKHRSMQLGTYWATCRAPDSIPQTETWLSSLPIPFAAQRGSLDGTFPVTYSKIPSLWLMATRLSMLSSFPKVIRELSNMIPAEILISFAGGAAAAGRMSSGLINYLPGPICCYTFRLSLLINKGAF